MGKDEKYKMADEKGSFPFELRDATIEEKKSYFKNYIVEHKFLKEAVDMAISFISTQVSERLIFVCGPSGIGKKEFIRLVKKRIVELASPILAENPGCIPVVDVEAIAPEKGSFNFANLWRSALISLAEPMIGYKISYREIESIDSAGNKIITSRVQKGDYLEILQNTLMHRNVRAMIINEAHHMLRVTSGKQVNWAIDLLKSLTNGSQTPIILVGTYELLTFLADLESGITDQINQRTKIINFPRYHTNKNSEINIFAKTAKLLLRNMPLMQTSENLVDEDWQYFYQYSLGCIGTLKIWFMDALSLALEEQAMTLTKEHLEKTKKPGRILHGMLDSIENGEQKMARLLSDGDIEARLGFTSSKNKPENDTDIGTSKMKSKINPFEKKTKTKCCRYLADKIFQKDYSYLLIIFNVNGVKVNMYSDNSYNYRASRLFHLQPIGVGTPYVESLTSYIKRLAEAHSVSPGVLLSKEILPSVNKDYLSVNKYCYIESRMKINTASEASMTIVRVLEEKTCNYNLKYLTMSVWRDCFSKEIFRKNCAWCPICFQESIERNEPVYEQLIWDFNDIEICRKHQVMLVQKCPFCNSEFSNFSNLARVGFCSKCNSWLGTKKYEIGRISPIDADWYNWAYENIGQLLSIAPTIKEIKHTTYINNIKKICETYNLSIRNLAKEINVNHVTINKWILGNNKPCLSNILVLSFLTGHSVYEFITKEIEFPKGELFYKGMMIRKNNRNKKVNICELKKALEDGISTNNGVSLHKISIQFGIKPFTIKKYFPTEVTKLKENYNKYLNDCRLNKSMLIKNTMKLLWQRGIFPSRKALTRELGKRVINNDYYKKVWKDTLEELGCAYFGRIRTLIPATSGQRFGIIRTA